MENCGGWHQSAKIVLEGGGNYGDGVTGVRCCAAESAELCDYCFLSNVSRDGSGDDERKTPITKTSVDRAKGRSSQGWAVCIVFESVGRYIFDITNIFI